MSGPVAIDLFSGAGGLSEGLMMSGVHVAAAVELHPQPALTHAFNHASTSVIVGDVRRLDYSLLEREVRARSGTAVVDLVVGGPPCQGFSSAGKKAATDPRNGLFRAFVSAIEHFRPAMFVMENVPGFKSMYEGAIYREATEALGGLGYELADSLLAAADYGVPQTRRRFVMVGWRSGLDEFQWPEPSHQGLRAPDIFSASLPPTPTAGDALADLSFVEPGFEATRYASSPQTEFASSRRAECGLLFNHLTSRHRAKAVEMFSKIRVGGSIRDLPADERTKKLTMVRLDPGRVSNTVVSLPDDMLHFGQNRILSVRETARLQTFDDDFVFFGKRTSGYVERRVDVPQYTQVGNAVPPLLGAALGAAIARTLGAEANDQREITERRRRHELVRGSSGFAGYVLDSRADDAIRLMTVDGQDLPLPIARDELAVRAQAAMREWKAEAAPRNGQWAPGVRAKDLPAWATQTELQS